VEKRSDRRELSPVDQLIIDALRGLRDDVKEIKNCKDECNLPDEMIPNLHQISDIVVEKAKGAGNNRAESFSIGLTKGRDENKQVEKALSTREKVKDWALKALVGALVGGYLATKMGWV
jgi:hypothetical protein